MQDQVLLAVFLCITASSYAMETVYLQSNCGNTKNLWNEEAIRLKATPGSVYKPDIGSCSFTVDSVTNRLMIQFIDLSIEYSSFCSNDWLKIYDGDSTTGNSIGKFCGTSTPSTIYTTSGSDVTFNFHTDGSTQLSGFDIIITPFHTGFCYSWEIDCNNGRCVDDSLACNGFNPCGDHSDCKLSAGSIAGIIVGSIMFVVIVVIVVVVVRRRRFTAARIPAPQVASAYVTTISTSGGAATGYSQPVPPQYSHAPQATVGYPTGYAPPPQPLTSYPPPPYSNQQQY